MPSEIASRASFETIRYGQCWEDADVLLAALEVKPGQVCLSISSAGDNTLALLTCRPSRVIALDLNPAQLACLELRVAAYRELSHLEMLEMMGSRASRSRDRLYQRCRPLLSLPARTFWDAHPEEIRRGIGNAGKFEHYLSLFRRLILPCIHSRRTVDELLADRSLPERREFYDKQWDSWRWRCLFRFFFSRWIMGYVGRDPEFFKYAKGDVANRILARTRHALVELNPVLNPYVQWILTGTHGATLPLPLRPENFDRIRENLSRLEWHLLSIEDFLAKRPGDGVDRYNLSDIFEYISEEHYYQLLEQILKNSSLGTRLTYWNLQVPRCRPNYLAEQLRPLEGLATRLYLQDKAFFYSALVIEEVF